MMDDWRERRYRRFRLVCPVRLNLQFDGSAAVVETISENVSICGLLVRSSSMIPQHTPVTFIISVQGKEVLHPFYLAGQGQILRVESIGLGAGFAIAISCEMPITQLDKHLPGVETGNFESSA